MKLPILCVIKKYGKGDCRDEKNEQGLGKGCFYCFIFPCLKQLNMFRYLRTIGIVAISVFMVASCSGPGEIHEYSVNDLEFSLEGPLFAGPNSG